MQWNRTLELTGIYLQGAFQLCRLVVKKFSLRLVCECGMCECGKPVTDVWCFKIVTIVCLKGGDKGVGTRCPWFCPVLDSISCYGIHMQLCEQLQIQIRGTDKQKVWQGYNTLLDCHMLLSSPLRIRFSGLYIFVAKVFTTFCGWYSHIHSPELTVIWQRCCMSVSVNHVVVY